LIDLNCDKVTQHKSVASVDIHRNGYQDNEHVYLLQPIIIHHEVVSQEADWRVTALIQLQYAIYLRPVSWWMQLESIVLAHLWVAASDRPTNGWPQAMCSRRIQLDHNVTLRPRPDAHMYWTRWLRDAAADIKRTTPTKAHCIAAPSKLHQRQSLVDAAMIRISNGWFSSCMLLMLLFRFGGTCCNMTCVWSLTLVYITRVTEDGVIRFRARRRERCVRNDLILERDVWWRQEIYGHK